jgi:tetratricopeptide (TPR) repeat protein
MLFTLGQYYARLPTPLRECLTTVLWVLGLGVMLLFIALTALDADAYNEWVTDPRLKYTLIGLTGFITGVFGNIAADRYLNWEALRLPSVREFFDNHHLTTLVGQSLGMILRSVAEQLPNPADSPTIYKLARHLEQNWETIVASASAQEWLGSIKDNQLVAFIRDPRRPALTDEQLTELLKLINPDYRDLPIFLDPESEQTVRKQLSRRFGEALRLSLKRDFAQRGEAAMGMFLDIAAQLLNRSVAAVPRTDENAAAVEEIRYTLRYELVTRLVPDDALRTRIESLAQQLDTTYHAVREEGCASARRDQITHWRLGWVLAGVSVVFLLLFAVVWLLKSGQSQTDEQLAQIQEQLRVALSPKQAGEDPTQRQLPPELIEQARFLLKRGNREQQALAEIALKNHTEADRIIQELKKDPLAEAFRVLMLEGDNWYNAGEFDRAIAPYEQALALQLKDLTARNNGAIAHGQAHLGDITAHQRRAIDLRKAIAAYEAALTVRTRAAHPVEWAMTQNNLGNAWRNMPTGDRRENLRKAIAACEAALTVLTRAAHPVEWARTRFNQGLVLQGLAKTGSKQACGHLRAAATRVKAAASVWTAEAFPHYHGGYIAPALKELRDDWRAQKCGGDAKFDLAFLYRKSSFVRRVITVAIQDF